MSCQACYYYGMRSKVFYDDIYQNKIYFITEYNQKQLERWLLKHGLEEEDYEMVNSGDGFCINTDGPKFIGVESKKAYYVVVHETAHLTYYTLRDAGVLAVDTEAFAYHQECWVRNIWRFMSAIS